MRTLYAYNIQLNVWMGVDCGDKKQCYRLFLDGSHRESISANWLANFFQIIQSSGNC